MDNNLELKEKELEEQMEEEMEEALEEETEEETEEEIEEEKEEETSSDQRNDKNSSDTSSYDEDAVSLSDSDSEEETVPLYLRIPRSMVVTFEPGCTVENVDLALGNNPDFDSEFLSSIKKIEVTFNDEATSIDVFHYLLFMLVRFRGLQILLIKLNNTAPIKRKIGLMQILKFQSLMVLKIRSKRTFTINYLRPLLAPSLAYFGLVLENNANLSNVEQTKLWEYISKHAGYLLSVVVDLHDNDYLFAWQSNKNILKIINCYQHSKYISKVLEGIKFPSIDIFAFIDDSKKIENFDEYYGHIFSNFSNGNGHDCDFYVTVSILKLIKSVLPSIFRVNIYIEEDEDPDDFLRILDHFKCVCPNVEKMRYNHIDLVQNDKAHILDFYFENMRTIKYYDMDEKLLPSQAVVKEGPSKKRRRR